MCLAIPGKIVEISPDNANSAMVDVSGVRRRVDLGLLEEDRPERGDWVLIHVGFAMSKISEQDALEQMNTLAMLGETHAVEFDQAAAHRNILAMRPDMAIFEVSAKSGAGIDAYLEFLRTLQAAQRSVAATTRQS